MLLPSLSLSHSLLGHNKKTCERITNKRAMWSSGHRVRAYIAFVLFSAFAICAPPAAASADSDLILIPSQGTPLNTCAQALGDSVRSEEKLLLCQLYESSALLTQLSALVNQGLDRLIISQAMSSATATAAGQPELDNTWNEQAVEQREKKKHEYLRFGKRKHEYLRFGKRKHEYLRFG